MTSVTHRRINVKSHVRLCVALVSALGCQSGATRDAEPLAHRPVSQANDIELAQYVPAEGRRDEGTTAELNGAHSLDFYVRYALQNNSAIQAALNDVEAARHRIPQERSLQDPTLEANGYPFFPNTPQSASGRATAGIGVAQKFPWFGKLRLQGEMAHQELHIAEAQLAATQLEIIEQTKRVYFDIYYVQRAIALNEENRRLLEQIVEIARIRYEVRREVSQQDPLRAEVELSNIDSELVRLRQDMASNQARLARLLHVSPTIDLRAADEFAETDVSLELDSLYERAIAERPELQAQLHAIERARNAKELACKQYYPDATLGVDWMENTRHKAIAPTADGVDDVGISLSVNLPIYRNRLDAAVREADARMLAAARRYDYERDRTLEMIKDLFAQVESQRELVRLLQNSVLPKSQQALQVSMAGYQAGQVDFQQLLSNFQEVLRVQLMVERQRTQLQQSLAALSRAVGGDLDLSSSQSR